MGRRKRAVTTAKAIKTLSGALHPEPGLWHFSWALVDRDCELAWPAPDSAQYAELATWIARISELELDDIFTIERHSGRGANHAISLENIEGPWRERWSQIFAERKLGLEEQEAFALVSLTYCTAARDSRRVIMAYQPDARVMYPVWWDPDHQVSGTNADRIVISDDLEHRACYHLSQRAINALREAWGYSSPCGD